MTTPSGTLVAHVVIDAYRAACHDGTSIDAFQVAAGTLMRLAPELSLVDARRAVAEMICGVERQPHDKVAEQGDLPWKTGITFTL